MREGSGAGGASQQARGEQGLEQGSRELVMMGIWKVWAHIPADSLPQFPQV